MTDTHGNLGHVSAVLAAARLQNDDWRFFDCMQRGKEVHWLCETHSVHQTAGRKQASDSTALQRVGPQRIAHRLELARHFHGNHPVQTPNTHPRTLQVMHSTGALSCLTHFGTNNMCLNFFSLKNRLTQ